MSTFVLIHGAWHGAWCWFKVIPLLRQQGHKVIAPDLPALGADNSPIQAASLQGYADRVCEVLDGQAEPVVLVGHSMGGVVISQAAEQRPRKVAKLVYLTAFLLRDGQTLLEVAQADTQAEALPNLVFARDQSSFSVREAMQQDVFYGDCSEEDVALAQALLVPQAAAPFATPVHTTADNWGRIPRFYIECVRDRAVSVSVQRRMYDELPCQRVVSMDTSHSPFFSAPKELAGHLTAF